MNSNEQQKAVTENSRNKKHIKKWAHVVCGFDMETTYRSFNKK